MMIMGMREMRNKMSEPLIRADSADFADTDFHMISLNFTDLH